MNTTTRLNTTLFAAGLLLAAGAQAQTVLPTHYDKVQFQATPVPEPAAALLMLAGGAGLVLRRGVRPRS